MLWQTTRVGVNLIWTLPPFGVSIAQQQVLVGDVALGDLDVRRQLRQEPDPPTIIQGSGRVIDSRTIANDRIEELKCLLVLQGRVVSTNDTECRALLLSPPVFRHDCELVMEWVRKAIAPGVQRYLFDGPGDESNPAANLLMHILAAVAQFERELIHERLSAGMKAAKTHGTKTGNAIGRPRRIFNRDEVVRLRGTGLSIEKVARQMRIGVGTVVRVIKAAGTAQGSLCRPAVPVAGCNGHGTSR